MLYFKLGGARVSFEANQGFKQAYELLVPPPIIRMASGAGISLSTPINEKLKTVISASGIRPPGLNGLNLKSALLLECAEAHSVQGVGASNIITIPAARRTDAGYEPFGIAIVNNREVRTGIASVVGNQYTVETHPDATAYEVGYFPKITVFARWKSSGGYAWSLVCEEV